MKNLQKQTAQMAILIVFMAVLGCKTTEPEPDVLKVLGQAEKVNGVGYAELNIIDMTKLLVLPADKTNPYLDETGAESVTAKQPVAGFTILASNFGGKSTRSLTIPASNYVYLSPLGNVSWYYENDKCDPDWQPKAGQSLKDFLYQELATFSDLSKGIVSVKLDGVELMADKTKFRFKTEVFETVIHKDFISATCDYTGQKAKVISDSYNILMKIPKGKHILIMKGTIPAAVPADTFEAEVTWNLTVE